MASSYATGDVAPRKTRGAKSPPQKPKLERPDDFETEQDFLAHARKLYDDDMDADKLNRQAALEDAEFFAGKQWDDFTRQRREIKRKPVLTVNRTVAFVGQVVGTRRQNDTQ